MNNLTRRLFLNSAQICGFFIAMMFISIFMKNDTFSVGGFACAISFNILLIIAYKSYDSYVLDFNKKQFYTRRKFFSWVFSTCIAHFDDIVGVSVDGELHSANRVEWWEYFTIIILKNGKTYRISDYQASFFSEDVDDEKFFRESEEVAKQLAEILQVKFYPGKRQHFLIVTSKHGQLEITHKAAKRRLMYLYLIGLALIMMVIIGKLLIK
ncbi:hypothetical protein [Candidatus Uabimicrobium amorphum]|nr:hypothetical protein [Candidatus Uabimicrobium amorphum]